MKKIIAVLILSSIINCSIYAQKGSVEISPALELGVPINFKVIPIIASWLPIDYVKDILNTKKLGIGASIKGLYNINDRNAITFTASFTSHSRENLEEYDIIRTQSKLISILGGYRFYIKNLYVEPQLGYGKASARIDFLENIYTQSISAFNCAIGIGYTYRNIDISTRYQRMFIGGNALDIIGIRLGYNFNIYNPLN